MKDNALAHTIAGAIITTGLTLSGTAYLQNKQNETAERVRFLDGAQATAQATTKLLIQGYNALKQLKDATEKKGFQFYITDSGRKFEEFYRDWRQHMIQNQFSVSRYYGTDLASQLIHVDEIDKAPVNNLSSPNPCSAPGTPDSYDINKMAVQVDCLIHFSSLTQDRLDSDEPGDKEEFFDHIAKKSALDRDVRRMIDNYEVSYVKVLRSMDDKFTQLGGVKVTVLPRG
ncbi:hypothetical protein GIV19_19775 [Pseudomonas syringae]|uniref:hypothetical protein n=1 Tax=Pseudomonas syringae TaxID=317 RepID=UPI001F2F1FB2|nr:hypothetical protein [Pseudomonas syringae]MCF5709504.1 hypothetical protein [Pseudomonas syringae]